MRVLHLPRRPFQAAAAAVGVSSVLALAGLSGPGPSAEAANPNPKTQATVTKTVTAPPVTVTTTVTETVTAPPSTTTVTETVTAPPVTVTSTVPVTQTETVTASPTSSPTSETVTPSPTTTATPGPAAPSVPHMALNDLYSRTGTTDFATACRRLNTYSVIDLPSGWTGELVDFKDINAMSLYCPFVLGFKGDGSPTLNMRAYSATQHGTLTLRQAQGIDDNQSTGLRPYPTVNQGWTLNGTPQMDEYQSQSGRTLPMLYPGIVNYLGRGSYWSDLTITGFPGDFYYPPGETFQLSDYKTANAYYRNLHIDGRIAAGLPGAGERVGGSPFGSSGSKNVTIEDSWFGYSRASSLTFSFAGSEETGQNTDTVTVRNTTVERNANADDVRGHRFAGINFEGVRGKVVLDHVTIIMENPTKWWDQTHMSIASQMIDNPNYYVYAPKYNCLAAWTNCAFVVEEAGGYGTGNKQTSAPHVYNETGVELQPFFYRGTPPQGYVAPIDPSKQFIVFTR